MVNLLKIQTDFKSYHTMHIKLWILKSKENLPILNLFSVHSFITKTLSGISLDGELKWKGGGGAVSFCPHGLPMFINNCLKDLTLESKISYYKTN